MTQQKKIYGNPTSSYNYWSLSVWWWMASFIICGRRLSSRAFLIPLSTKRVAFRQTCFVLPLVVFSTSVTALLSSSSSSSPSSSTSVCNNELIAMTGYLNAADAAALDAELMSTPGYSLEQLMELAGLAVAEAVYQAVPPSPNNEEEKKKKILLICGPGNNGGDGLVAARHLFFFDRYECTIVYPKRVKPSNPYSGHFDNLIKQCLDVDIPILDELPTMEDLVTYDAIVDAIFGFGFVGTPREPFATILQQVMVVQKERDIPILSVDVPSGWDVNDGDVANLGFVPNVLISLTTPKLCSKNFPGRHFIGGRFLPPGLAAKYNVQMPPYPGVSQVMEVTQEQIEGTSTAAGVGKGGSHTDAGSAIIDSSWREEYARYLSEQYEMEQQRITDMSRSSSVASTTNDVAGTVTAKGEYCEGEEQHDEPSSIVEESWEIQYATYCAEKEAQLAREDARYREALRRQE